MKNDSNGRKKEYAQTSTSRLIDSLEVELVIVQENDFTSTTLINQYLARMPEEV